MSRSGYVDDFYDTWAMLCWRGAVATAANGKRGQAFFKELLAVLDAMPQKKLIAGALETNGDVCALGAVGKARGIEMSSIDVEDGDRIADVFGIAPALAREIMFVNDEGVSRKASPESRFREVREWVLRQIKRDPLG